MTKDDYVSLEVAKKLQEKGYDEPCLAYYFHEKLINVTSQFRGSDVNTIYQESRSQMYGNVPAPTLYDAQKWLRDNKNIHVCTDNRADGWFYVLYKSNNGTFIRDYNYSGTNDGGCWDTYEEALNAGILEALNYI